jgi:hypothetical protein
MSFDERLLRINHIEKAHQALSDDPPDAWHLLASKHQAQEQ